MPVELREDFFGQTKKIEFDQIMVLYRQLDHSNLLEIFLISHHFPTEQINKI